MPFSDSYARTHPRTIAARRQQRQRWIQIRARRLGRQCPAAAQNPAVLARLAKTPLGPARASQLAHRARDDHLELSETHTRTESRLQGPTQSVTGAGEPGS